MSKSTYVIAASLFLLALIGALAVLMVPSAPLEPIKKTSDQKTQVRKPQELRSPSFGEDFSSARAASSVASVPTDPQAQVMTPKEQAMTTLHDAMVTYSAEGVPAIQPMLSNKDPEIRATAIESMKQLGVPEAAAALRAAAQQTSDAGTKAAMIEAAEFVEMPSAFVPQGN